MANETPQPAVAPNDNPFVGGGVDTSAMSGGKPPATDALNTTSPQTPPAPLAPADDQTPAPAAGGETHGTPDEIKDPAAYTRAMEEKYQRLLSKRETSLQEALATIAKLNDEKKNLEDKQASLVQERIGLLESELKREMDAAQTAKIEALQVKIAVEAGLPLELAERLQGTNEAELKADADKLAALLPKQSPAQQQGKRVLSNTGQPAPDDLSWLTQRGQGNIWGGGGVYLAKSEEE